MSIASRHLVGAVMLHHHRPHAVGMTACVQECYLLAIAFFCSAAATWHTSRIASHCKRSGCTFYGSTETPNGYVQFTSSVIYFICLLPLWSRRSWNLSELFWLNVLFLISFLWFPIFFFGRVICIRIGWTWPSGSEWRMYAPFPWQWRTSAAIFDLCTECHVLSYKHWMCISYEYI